MFWVFFTVNLSQVCKTKNVAAVFFYGKFSGKRPELRFFLL